MIITKPGFYKQYDNGKAEVVAVRGEYAVGFDASHQPAHWLVISGQPVGGFVRTPWALKSEWVEPNSPVVSWVNVYDDGSSHGYATMNEATNAAHVSFWRRLALVKLTYDNGVANAEVVEQ